MQSLLASWVNLMRSYLLPVLGGLSAIGIIGFIVFISMPCRVVLIKFPVPVTLEEAIEYARIREAKVQDIYIQNVKFKEERPGQIEIISGDRTEALRFEPATQPDSIVDSLSYHYQKDTKHLYSLAEKREYLESVFNERLKLFGLTKADSAKLPMYGTLNSDPEDFIHHNKVIIDFVNELARMSEEERSDTNKKLGSDIMNSLGSLSDFVVLQKAIRKIEEAQVEAKLRSQTSISTYLASVRVKAVRLEGKLLFKPFTKSSTNYTLKEGLLRAPN